MMMNSSTSGRKGGICMSVEDGCELRRGPWTLEEDNLLIHYITSHGEGQWNSLAKCAGLKRTGKSCRLRWLNYLKPDIKRGNLTPHEQLLILELHTRWGNRWSKIAQHLPGRTDNEIKNYWRTRVQKQARHLKVDSNSSKFLETFRMFWMPRLLEKIEQDHSSSSSITTLENQPLPSSDSNNSKLPEVSSGQGQEDEECYHVDVPMQQLDHTCLHVDDGDWMGEGLGSSFWNNDELWELVYREVEPEG